MVKKGTGVTYNSNSGHAYFIKYRSEKLVQTLVYSKKCVRCDVAVKMGKKPMGHEDCPRNYLTGSNKAMEASDVLVLMKVLDVLGIGVEYIISDDDSTMHAHLYHIGYQMNAKLPLNIHEPKFSCDSSHRIKVMVKEIFTLAL